MFNSSQWKIVNKMLNYLLVALVIGYIAYFFYKKPKFSEGEVAQDFTAQTINGEQFQLSAMKGNYVLLDFWGSWCGPCRQENKEIVAFYNRYQANAANKSLKIVSIAIETDSTQWQRAIAADQLNWPHHIGQLERFNSPIAKLYGIHEIPTKYLINPDGIIIKVNPKVSELEALIH